MKRNCIPFFALLSLLASFSVNAQQLSFIENKHQWESFIQYKTVVPQGEIYFTSNAFRYVFYDKQDLDDIHELKHHDYQTAYQHPVDCYAYDVRFIGAQSNPAIQAKHKKAAYHNYFLGNDPAKWAGKVGLYEGIRYRDVYTGIDIEAYSVAQNFKYDLIVKAHANPSLIQLKYDGVHPVLLPDGKLQLNLGFKTIQESAPYTYQMIQGKKKEVACRYVLHQDQLGFEFPDGYDTNADLIIDPTLIFQTYSSGTATTYGFSATYDLSGNLYAGGECFGVGWPSTVGAFQLAYAGGVDAGINKYNAVGSALIYSTYYGGSSSDLPNNMVVNANNELAITGSTSSPNLPTTFGCYDNSNNGGADAYVAHFDAAGATLIGATYVGGSAQDATNSVSLSPNYGDQNRGEIFYDANGDIVVATSTQSSNFPVTAGAYQTTFGGGTQDGIFFKLNFNCTSLLFSTFLGGSNLDACFSVVKNSAGNWVIAGGTNSTNFPTTAGSYTPNNQGGTDGFVTILNNTATALVKSTYIGTSAFDHAFKVQVDNNDTVYVCGQTDGANFPVSAGAYTNAGGNIFIQKLQPDLGAMIRSTVIGYSGNLIPTAFLKDFCGNVYFTGFGAGTGLPLTNDAFQTNAGGFWICVITGDFNSLVYATYMGVVGDHVDGGTSRFDPQGIVYHSVCTSSANQYQSPGCLSPTNQAGSWDVASFKFNFGVTPITANLTISPNDSGCAPYTMVFNNTSTTAASYFWDFDDGNTSTVTSPVHTFQNPGTYNVMLVAVSSSDCISNDTAYVTIKVLPDVYASFHSEIHLGCARDTVKFAIDSLNQASNVTYQWYFGDGAQSNIPIISHVYNVQNTYTVMCVASNGYCNDTAMQVINLLHPINAGFFTATTLGSLPTDSICLGTNLFASAVLSSPQGFLEYAWDWGDGSTDPFTSVFSTSHMYTSGGRFLITLTVKDTLGCTDTAQQWVFVENADAQTATSSESIACVGEPIRFLDSMIATVPAFAWDFGDGAIENNTHDPIHTWDQAGNYLVTLTSQYDICPDITSTLNIEIEDYPQINLGSDTTICPNITGTIVLSNLINPNQVLTWNTGDVTNSLSVVNTGHYWASATSNKAGCTTTDSIWIMRDCYLNIPNSFSPNGDGLNDYFIPRELLSSGVTIFRMNIYNRWGENIFTTTALDGRGWDGKFNGKLQNMGVYVYVIDVAFKNGVKKTFEGNVTLMR